MQLPLPRTIRAAACGTALLAVLVMAGGTPASAAPPPPLPAEALAAGLQQVRDAGMPGVFAEVRDGKQVWRGARGYADVTTRRAMLPGFQHRIGSISKTFLATTLLQLVGEGRLTLDAPFGDYLPEYAIDGVTVRMLLNHTSGIGDYDSVLFQSGEDIERIRSVTYPPDEVARIGLGAPRTGAPGESYAYSNTNFVLAGLILERVTGRPAAEEMTRRIIRPLGLYQTYFPATSTTIVGPHSAGYIPWYDGELRDFSEYNMSVFWGAGDVVSTSADLDTFFRALLRGKLLEPAELAEMRTTVPMDPAFPDAAGYGLGLYWVTLPCGQVWGHDGLVFGHSTISWHSPDGRRQATIAENMTHYALPGQPNPITDATFEFLVTALCGTPAPAPTAARAAAAAVRPPWLTPVPGAPAPTPSGR
ncbi:serine hydrolase domain-containing protein [Micromonospora sp. NPDC049559]|uniref:serine hydrolase domain-containing protein n=1 Tax=Micromonospora sp. NPDC049559 TaxID=3155923 RepID=UPI0034178357